eukprot:717011-Pelagomonas_calceolata.AAC.1
MLAGGTGVTPMYQVLNAILKNPADKTQCNCTMVSSSVLFTPLRQNGSARAQAHTHSISLAHMLTRTQVSLIFGNIAEEDILLRKELDSLAQAHPHQLKVRALIQTLIIDSSQEHSSQQALANFSHALTVSK